MTYCSLGGPDAVLTDDELKQTLFRILGRIGSRRRIMAVPPDITRLHSRAGLITRYALDFYGDALTDILPALGTHAPMTETETGRMFPGVPRSLFRPHRWRTDLNTLGTVPGSFVKSVSGGRLDYDWPAQVNRLLAEGEHDLVLSPGQVVPHEVIGMANHAKNIFVGIGGAEGIHKSHFLGAVHGMERIMGRIDTPVRAVLDYAADHFARNLPILYILTVIGADPDGKLRTRGLFIGDDRECFESAAELSRLVNFTMLDEPIQRCVVHLDPEEYRSTWLGNKAIYRTRMAMADGGELIVMAPGVKEFGEDPQIDRLIRTHGYRGTNVTLDAVKTSEELAANLSAAAHLIHGSTEGRFNVTWAPGRLTRAEVESVGYDWGNLDDLLRKYDPSKMKTGWNRVDGERIFFVANPALGLWAHPARFTD